MAFVAVLQCQNPCQLLPFRNRLCPGFLSWLGRWIELDTSLFGHAQPDPQPLRPEKSRLSLNHHFIGRASHTIFLGEQYHRPSPSPLRNFSANSSLGHWRGRPLLPGPLGLDPRPAFPALVDSVGEPPSHSFYHQSQRKKSSSFPALLESSLSGGVGVDGDGVRKSNYLALINY